MNKNKVSDMAKDFGLTSKDILSVLSTYEDGSKKPSQVLSADEVNLIFEHLTQKHQVKIESIYAESAPQKKTDQGNDNINCHFNPSMPLRFVIQNLIVFIIQYYQPSNSCNLIIQN